MQSSISVHCKKDNLKSIRAFLGSKLQEASISDSDINLIVLAVDEICANIIIHSNKCDESKVMDLEIQCILESSTLKINLLDEGEFFDFSLYQESTLQSLVEQEKKGGLGLKLVRKIMDQIEFSKLGERNLCTMIKKVQMNYFTPSF